MLPQTCTQHTLTLLLHHFPWLVDEDQEVSGADVVDEVRLLFETLLVQQKIELTSIIHKKNE